jgi:hypothetical protein
VKISISLESIPLKVEIEGDDVAMTEIGIIIEDTLARMKKVWLDTLKRQTKLAEESKE